MVQPVAELAHLPTTTQNRPRLVEIIGVAGCGKTTLTNTLLQSQDHYRLVKFPNPNKKANAGFFMKNGLAWIPTLLPQCLPTNRLLTVREFAWLSILRGWPTLLQKDIQMTDKVTLLDQGPVYLFVELLESGPSFLKSARAEKLWDPLYRRWAGLLDGIVWLDAPDEVLMERIRTRKKDHLVKHEADGQMLEFLRSFRSAFQRLILRWEEQGLSPRVVRFDTGKMRPEEIAAALKSEFGLE